MQNNKLYVGNLSYSSTADALRKLFEDFGTVQDVKIIEGKGFGFVEMSTPEEAETAKSSLNNKDFGGRNIKVDIALPPKPRSDRGFSNNRSFNRY